MLNDRAKQLPAEHPVVMELYNPLGQMYARKTGDPWRELGLYAFDFVTEGGRSCSALGTWKVQVGGVSFSKRLRIESIKTKTLEDRLIHAGEDLCCVKGLWMPA